MSPNPITSLKMGGLFQLQSEGNATVGERGKWSEGGNASARRKREGATCKPVNAHGLKKLGKTEKESPLGPSRKNAALLTP